MTLCLFEDLNDGFEYVCLGHLRPVSGHRGSVLLVRWGRAKFPRPVKSTLALALTTKTRERYCSIHPSGPPTSGQSCLPWLFSHLIYNVLNTFLTNVKLFSLNVQCLNFNLNCLFRVLCPINVIQI